MDNSADSIPEYGWKHGHAAHVHSYLLGVIEKALMKLIAENKCATDKPAIFDAGCGNGFIAGHFLARGYNVAGCDSSADGIEIAKKNYPNGKFELCSVYDDLAAEFGSDWDIVISTEVVEHLYEPRTYIKNVFQLLRPGGCLIISTPYHGYFKNLALALTGKMDSHFTALWDGGHIKFWSKKTLENLLQEAGFKINDFSGAGRFPLLWKSMVITAIKP